MHSSELPHLRPSPFVVPALLLLAAAPAAQGDRHFEIWSDPVEFEQVSNALQNLLIAKFGPRVGLDEAGRPIPPSGSGLAAAAPSSRPRLEAILPDFLVNDPTADATSQDTQSETTLVRVSDLKLVAAFNDSGSFLGGSHFTGWAHTSDGGLTWTDGGVLPGNNDAGDPVLARDEVTGRIYLACLFFSGSGINCFRSDDDGVTWLPSVNCAPSTGSMDKEWITVDNYPGAGQGNVYHVVRDFGGGNGVRFFRSLDQGATWGPFNGTLIASGSPSNVQGAFVVVTPNHDVHAFWYDSNPSPDELRTRRSSDFGVTWSAPVTVTTLTSTATNGSLTLVAGFRSNSFPQVAANPVNGDLYLVYNDPAVAVGGDRGNILLCQSTDNALTWSAPVQVNDDATALAQYFPAIAVRPDGTGLSIGWYDNRNDPADVDIERWGVTASISGSTVTFGPNFRISPQFPPVFGVDPVVNFVYMGDYDQLAAGPSGYYSTWGDNRDNSIAVPSRKNANVRFASYAPDGPGALLDFVSVSVAAGNGNALIDPNECNELTITVHNDGSLPATGVVGTLTTTTPNVTVATPVQAFPDVAVGSSEGNTIAFEVSTSALFACPLDVDFVLTLDHDTGTVVLPFTVEGATGYQVNVGAGSLTGGGADIGNHGSNVVTTVALPFPVTFYSTVYNQITLSSNGNAQFTTTNTTANNGCLPTAAFGPAILPHWDNLRTDGTGDGIFISTSGTAPNRVFHVVWRTRFIFTGSGDPDFELRLHEGSTDFELVYGNLPLVGSGATVGCQDGAGEFTEFSCNQGGNVGPGILLSFTLPTCPDGGGDCGPQPPVIASVSPAFGPNTGVTGVVIQGQHFTGASAVLFGTDAASFTVDSDLQITADLGATAATGHVDVSVTTGLGTDTLTDGFDLFAPPADVGTPCASATLTWSGAPILGETYTVTTENLNGSRQYLLVDWSNVPAGNPHFRRFGSVPPCSVDIHADEVLALGTNASHDFDIPVDLALIGVHLRTQARLVSPPVTTQVLDAVIGE